MGNVLNQLHKVVLAGGGTGGHVTPALALADAFRAQIPACDVLFIGTPQGMEATLVPKHGWRIETVPGSRLVGGGVTAKFRGMRNLLAGVMAARKILQRERPSLVIGVGGYASGAALLAARLLGIPTAVHESNAVPGMTNRVLGMIVDRVYLGFAAARGDFPGDAAVVSGNPVRPEIRVVGSGRERAFGFASGERLPRVLVVGGSQGSEFLNEHVPGLLASLNDLGVKVEVRHQVGKLDGNPVAARYLDNGLTHSVATFIDDMASAYAWADFAVTRSGSGTVSELAAAALPALLVPFPFAAGDHQAANAKAFADAGAGLWVRQGDWNEMRLAQAVKDLLTTPGKWQTASLAARQMAGRDAALAVVEDCQEWLGARG
jgi:UDP-N-acetylglucosamine--N-acetylmuramyl-(pentapeptide) pyrophosphoryl-undecaprenol N-acetylglucosamine transferase